MRLLSPSAQKDEQGRETALDLLRSEEKRKLINDLNLRAAKAEADFQSMLAGQRARWANEEGEHIVRKGDMQKEIDELEAKKLNALIPFNILKEGTDDRFKEANDFLYSLRSREERADDLIETFEDKLDELGEREQNIRKSESLLSFEREGVDRQREDIQSQSELLTQKMLDFSLDCKTRLKKVEESEKEAIFRERSVSSREEALKKQEKSLAEWDIRLHQERQLLQSAWDELRRKSQ